MATQLKVFTMCIKKSLFLVIFLFGSAFVKAQTNRNIVSDLNQKPETLSTSFRRCIGAGRANEGLRADWQQQLRMIKKDCGFEYIRFHGLLMDDMGVYKEDNEGQAHYNFQYIDQLYDFLLSINIRPFVELSFMPKDLASQNATVFWWKGNITPPKDARKWSDLITALVEHFTQRYGQQEVAKWYFEVWNEPNLNIFFSGSQHDYFRLYEQTALAIKKVSKKYRVGGPATAENEWIPEFIGYCSDNRVPLDFITTHDYGALFGAVDPTGNMNTIVHPDKNDVPNNMLKVKKQILDSAMPDLELHYTEWGSSFTPTDYLHDAYQQAPYLLNTIKRAGTELHSLSYWTFTDIFEENGPRFTPFHGGFGLLNYQSIAKPSYYSFFYLNRLGEQHFPCSDDNAYVCRDKKGNVQILLWDCTIDHPGDRIDDQVFYSRVRPAKSAGAIHIRLKGLSPGKYALKIYRTGYCANDPFTTYLDMGRPDQLTKSQVADLNKTSQHQPISSESIIIKPGGNFFKIIKLLQNDIYFVEMIKT